MMSKSPIRQHGTSLIEVMVTMVILAFGLLGMAGLQVKLQASEMEAYQRSQALLLLGDIANRMAVNRSNAASYVVAPTSPLGVDAPCPTASATVAQRDLAQWCNALLGAAETSGTGDNKLNVGAMVGGRGCIEQVGNQYLVTVAWQGLTPIAAPPPSVACGRDSYDTANTPCVNDRCRRTVTTLVQMATL